MKATEDMVCVESLKKVMDIFGGKWSFLIMGELNDGPKRFNEMCKKLNISTKSLSDALKSLESNQIVVRTVLPTTPVTVEYSLTEKGEDFQNVFKAMRDWRVKWLQNDTID